MASPRAPVGVVVSSRAKPYLIALRDAMQMRTSIDTKMSGERYSLARFRGHVLRAVDGAPLAIVEALHGPIAQNANNSVERYVVLIHAPWQPIRAGSIGLPNPMLQGHSILSPKVS